jgi:hypothetical protein
VTAHGWLAIPMQSQWMVLVKKSKRNIEDEDV